MDNLSFSDRSYLNALLLRSEDLQPDLIEKLEMLGIFLGDGFYLEVLCAPLKLDSDLTNDDTNIFAALERTIHRTFYGKRLYYTTMLGGYFICLFCFPHIKTETETHVVRDAICKEMEQVFSEKSPFVGTVATVIGPICEGKENIYHMHDVNLEVFHYLQFTEAFPPLFILGRQPAPMISQFEEMKQISGLARRYSVCIKAGETVPRELFDQFYAHLVGDQIFTLHMVHFYIFAFLNSLLLSLYELAIVDHSFLGQHAIYQSLTESRTIHIFRDRFERFIESLMTLSKRRQRRLSPLKSEHAEIYKAYINHHIADPLLDVASAAEAMGVSQPLLSTVFKRKFGLSPSDYIRTARIDRTKQLLIETDLTLVQIASCAGFSSITTLQRAFRRAEGIPPGKFRATHRRAPKQDGCGEGQDG